MLRSVVCLLLAAGLVQADADSFVHRAQVRLDHLNPEGAKALLHQALAEDPACGPALAMLATLDQERAADLRLHYLADGRPLDVETARGFLVDLRPAVYDLGDEDARAIERATLAAAAEADEPCGPWKSYQPPDVLSPRSPPCGPLREEAFGGLAHAHRDLLGKVTERFGKEGIDDARCWGAIAVLQKSLGDIEGARSSLSHAHPGSLDERLACAECTLLAADDPYAWWRLHGDRLLDEVSARGPVPAGAPLSALWVAARDVLVEHQDLVGAARLAIARIEIAPLADAAAQSAAVDGIDRGWVAEDAYRMLQEMPGSGAACLRGLLLLAMLQDDLGVKELEEVVRADPAYLPAWSALYLHHQAAHCFSRALQCAEPLEQAFFTRRTVVASGFGASYVGLLRWVRGEAAVEELAKRVMGGPHDPAVVEYLPMAAVPSEDVIAAVDRLPDMRAYEVEALAIESFDAGREDLGLSLFDRISAKKSKEVNLSWSWQHLDSGDLRRTVARLKFFASHMRLSRAQEAALRRISGVCGPTEDPSPREMRLRKELDGDAEFLGLPGGAYVLSLVTDARFNPDRGRRLRRESYDEGFRAPQMLFEMAMDGEAVLPDLEAIDTVAARLVVALHSDGVEALDRLPEDDEAWPDQLRIARQARRRRGKREEAPKREPWTPSIAAAALWEEAHTDPRRAAHDLADSPERFLAWTPVERAREMFRAKAIPFEELLRRARRGEESWPQRDGAYDRIEKADKAEIEAFLGGPRGPGIARDIFYHLSGMPQFSHECSKQAEQHPLDLRWAQVEVDGTRSSQEKTDLSVPTHRLFEARLGNASALAAGLPPWGCEKEEEVMKWYILARQGDPFESLVQRYAPGSDHSVLTGKAMVFLRERCSGSEDLNTLSFALQCSGMRDASAAIDAELASCSDPQVRLDIFERNRLREEVPTDPADAFAERRLSPGVARDPEATAAFAREKCWNDAQASVLWAFAAVDALAARKGDLFREALEGLWRRGEVEPYSPDNQGVNCPIVWYEILEKPETLQMLAPLLAKAHGSDALFYFTARTVERKPPEGVDLKRALHEADLRGFLTAGEWEMEVATEAPGEPLAALKRLLSGLREPRDAYFMQATVSTLVCALGRANRDDEAIACADAWGERCGPIDDAERTQERREVEYSGSMRCPEPFELASCFSWGHILPPGVLSAIVLASCGYDEAALARFDAVEHADWPADTRIECARARASIALDNQKARRLEWSKLHIDNPDHAHIAVTELFRLLREYPQLELRVLAHACLRKLYVDVPGAREGFVDDFLQQMPKRPPMPAEAVRPWEDKLCAESPEARGRAEEELRVMGSAAIPLLVELRATQDAEVRARAEELLEDLAAP